MNSKITYHQQVSYCGKPRCRRCREGIGHGPYWYAYQTVNGRTVRTYVGKEPPAEMQPTPEEAKEAITGYLAYFGTYTVDESVRTITHHRKANVNPGQVGDDVVRAYVFGAGDRVILTPTGATNQIIWERAIGVSP